MRARGFSLFEMIVVLLMVSLATTLMMQGVSYISGLRSRVAEQLHNQREGLLATHWIRVTLGSVYPDYEKPFGGVVGSAERVTALTLNALDAEPGVPAWFAWSIVTTDSGHQLRYQGRDGQSWQVSEWTGDGARFEYMGPGRQWHDHWPPRNLEEEMLPSLVAIHIPAFKGVGTRVVYIPADWSPPSSEDTDL